MTVEEEAGDLAAEVRNAQDAPPGTEPEVRISEEELKSLCEQHVSPKCAVKEEAEDVRLRAMAESENFKRRLTREMEEFRKYAGETVLADLLPVLDNLDLALAHGEGMEACKDFVTGVEMTRKVFLDTLKNHGLEVAGNPGEEFDPNIHEAMGSASYPDLPEDSVAQVLQKGYVLKGRLLRPAKVMVNKTG
ncbi:MAG: nucleotide exchange factor GrpE [Desulfovibrionaceae bacterium]